MSDRIQKVLAASGIASRRQAESWIAEGRVTINGQPAEPGQAVGPRDRVAIDGRQVRIDWKAGRAARGVLYHRSPGEGIKELGSAGEATVLERLPKVHGGRWIPVSAMSVGEGGLELFLTDGALVAALNKRTEEIPCEYSLRLRGQFDESRIPEILAAAAADTEARGTVELLEATGGEAANRWARIVCRGLRPRDLKRIFERCGIELNRTLRTRFGAIAMDRGMARGRSRELTEGELRSLAELAGLRKPPAVAPESGRRTGKPAGQRKGRSAGQPEGGTAGQRKGVSTGQRKGGSTGQRDGRRSARPRQHDDDPRFRR